mmetsp:Transcript_9618/g.14776  ORF Transcript_9618/g.14776 Transcript_9618/m.14776 type:complete len:153 (-) Transcript_9618:188-646(-)|eukprot:CAMPEP_0113944764 /NCGR_PEP_ID=MMETSP1339-20121228/36601_1 /TAXON_ID=94617 /ORGANISM="Fibrocapsa japonica" /LENGTH=152 /DNA_ID=CAMNT_0000950077 /DNA_START=76 /DNA_END=534 /DNA_ORIENTATION=+ /assembly_acc=CAM_ASM_000762
MAESQHGEPSEGLECMCCYDDINKSNYAEYQAEDGGQWLPAKFCESCISHLIATQWDQYVAGLAKATCKAEMRRLLDRGPPINVRDKTALPCPDDGEVSNLWFASDGAEHSAKLNGSLVGDERQAWWDEKLQFKFEEEDEDEDEQADQEEST